MAEEQRLIGVPCSACGRVCGDPSPLDRHGWPCANPGVPLGPGVVCGVCGSVLCPECLDDHGCEPN